LDHKDLGHEEEPRAWDSSYKRAEASGEEIVGRFGRQLEPEAEVAEENAHTLR
jgi:hypothetical protein